MRVVKPLVLALCLLALPAGVLAESWKQITNDMFIDTSSVTRSYGAVHVSVKYILDKDDGARVQKTLNAKVRPQYAIQRKNFYCNDRQVSTAYYSYYADKDTVLASGTLKTPQKTDVNPGSRIEPVFDFACPQR